MTTFSPDDFYKHFDVQPEPSQESPSERMVLDNMFNEREILIKRVRYLENRLLEKGRIKRPQLNKRGGS